MFGTFRYLLAIMVVVAHLAPMSSVHTGFYAVFAFFTLSGYLMCMVLRERYFRMESGVGKFYLNRLLRVMPAYWVVLVISAVFAAVFPMTVSLIHERMNLPEYFGDWLDNIFVIGLTQMNGLRSMNSLVPPAWSLAVELIFWALMPVLIRVRILFMFWGLFSLAYTISAFQQHEPIYLRYYSPLAASLPFFLGAWLYDQRKRIQTISPRIAFAGVAILVIYYLTSPYLWRDANYFTPSFSETSPLTLGLYVAIALNCIIITLLAKMDLSGISPQLKKWDEYLGNLSYPIFILHILAGIIVALLGLTYPERSWALFAWSLPVVNLMAAGLWYGVDKPVSKWRERVRC